ncbi:MAG: hypothetical protein ACFFG0_20000 [Candidatus Thorarchaeota archaeon]
MEKKKIVKLINNMRTKYKFLEKDLNKLEKALEEENEDEKKSTS